MRSGEALIVRAGALAAGLALLWAAPAGATTITVEAGADQFDENGTTCTLREAIEAARTNKAFGGCPKGSTKSDKIEMAGDVVLSLDGTGPNAGGDLDHDGGGKLTIVGTGGSFSPSQILVAAGWTERVLEVSGSPVILKNIEISDVDSQDNSGGAIRAAGNKAALKLIDVTLQGNNADLRGGAVACEGCKRLDLRGRFLVTGNSASGPGDSAGGAIWSNRPVTIKGKGSGFNQPQISNSSALSGPGDESDGGGIHAEDDLSITAAVLRQNQAVGGSYGSGGGIAMSPADDERITLKLTDMTVEENTASNAGGGVHVAGTDARLVAKRSAIIENEAELAGGVYTQADTTFTESAIDANVATAPDSSTPVSGGGVYAAVAAEPEANLLRFVRTSITNNDLASGNFQTGAGITALGTDLELINSTVSENQAPLANADGGGVFASLAGTEGGVGSARIEFTTFRGNEAGTGSDDGDAMYTALPSGTTIRSSIIDQGADGCETFAGTTIESRGFNVEDVIDTDCGIDAPTDSHDSDFLNALVYNGSPPVGIPGIPPFDTVTLPLTNAFTNNSSAALDLVPQGKCKVRGKRLKTDARGVPRPQGEGCDAGSTERVACRGVFVIGPNSDVGRKGDDQLQGSHATDDVFFTQGGDDSMNIYGESDTVCAGSGDDSILAGENTDSPDEIDAGKGTDFVSYNNGGPVTIDLELQTASGPNTGDDVFHSVEGVQGSEGGDSIFGSDGPNLLIGGGDPDTIQGRGGIDVIDAKDGEADVEINCGSGDNSKEKAKIDEGLDPQPVSC